MGHAPLPSPVPRRPSHCSLSRSRPLLPLASRTRERSTRARVAEVYQDRAACALRPRGTSPTGSSGKPWDTCGGNSRQPRSLAGTHLSGADGGGALWGTPSGGPLTAENPGCRRQGRRQGASECSPSGSAVTRLRPNSGRTAGLPWGFLRTEPHASKRGAALVCLRAHPELGPAIASTRRTRTQAVSPRTGRRTHETLPVERPSPASLGGGGFHPQGTEECWRVACCWPVRVVGDLPVSSGKTAPWTSPASCCALRTRVVRLSACPSTLPPRPSWGDSPHRHRGSPSPPFRGRCYVTGLYSPGFFSLCQRGFLGITISQLTRLLKLGDTLYVHEMSLEAMGWHLKAAGNALNARQVPRALLGAFCTGGSSRGADSAPGGCLPPAVRQRVPPGPTRRVAPPGRGPSWRSRGWAPSQAWERQAAAKRTCRGLFWIPPGRGAQPFGVSGPHVQHANSKENKTDLTTL